VLERASDLQGKQQQESLDTVEATVDEISHKHVAVAGDFAPDLQRGSESQVGNQAEMRPTPPHPGFLEPHPFTRMAARTQHKLAETGNAARIEGVDRCFTALHS